MSLFQAWIEPERALVAVDTLAYDHNHGGISEVLKMAALPHAQCVTLPGCAHLSAVEQPWAFTDLVQTFIDQLG